jgi:hypothetical protein
MTERVSGQVHEERGAVAVAVAVALALGLALGSGCKDDATAADPPSRARAGKAEPRRVVPPEVEGPGHLVDGPMAVLDGDVVHVAPPIDKLFAGRVGAGIAIPASGARRIGTPDERTELGTALAAAGEPLLAGKRLARTAALFVVDGRAAASAAAALSDALWATNRCPIPVVTVDGVASTFVETCESSADSFDDERVRITVFVTPTEYWVGLSRVNEFQQLPRHGGAHDDAALTAALRTHKMSAFFVDRVDIELAAAEGVSYAQVARTGAVMARAGFTAVRLLSADLASARPSL